MQADAMKSDAAKIERSVVEWLRAELDDPEITASDNFLDVGAHSLTFAKLNRLLSDSFGVALEARETYEAPLHEAVANRRSVDRPAHR